MVKWFFRLLIVLLLVGAGWYTWRTWDGKSQMEIRTVPVSRGILAVTVSATGRLAPTKEVQVGCEVSGTVEKIFVEHNDRVTLGQELIRLKPELARAEYEQAKADLARTEAQLKQAEVQESEAGRQFDRVKGLQAGEAASPEELKVRRAAYDAAQADVAAVRAAVMGAQSRVELARYRLDRMVIVSPIDGIVIDKRVDVGQTVAAAFVTPELVTLAEDLSFMRLLTDVSEADVGYICPGQDATFKVNAYRDRIFRGVVRQIRNQPKSIGNVVTYTVIIDVINNDQLLRPGMPADVTINIVKIDDTMKIANSALRFRPPLPPSEVRILLETLKYPPVPKPVHVSTGSSVKTRPSEISFVPPPIEPAKGVLWLYKSEQWEPIPVWTLFTDNRETALIGPDGLVADMPIITEAKVRASGQNALQKAIMLSRPENRQP